MGIPNESPEVGIRCLLWFRGLPVMVLFHSGAIRCSSTIELWPSFETKLSMASHNLKSLEAPHSHSLARLGTPQGHNDLFYEVFVRSTPYYPLVSTAASQSPIRHRITISPHCIMSGTPNHEVEQGRTANEANQDQAVTRHLASLSGVSLATHLPLYVTDFLPKVFRIYQSCQRLPNLLA